MATIALTETDGTIMMDLKCRVDHLSTPTEGRLAVTVVVLSVVAAVVAVHSAEVVVAALSAVEDKMFEY